jgi:hypothetical protein
MEVLKQFIVQTPIWVWPLLAYLITRGVKARKPGNTTLAKIAVIPVLFTAMSVHDLLALYGLTADTTGLWLVGIVAGVAGGWLIVSRMNVIADRSAGILRRPADYTLLPLVLLAFAIKYFFGVVASVSPELLTDGSFRVADVILSGLFTGLFIGKFARYAVVWFSANQSFPAAG